MPQVDTTFNGLESSLLSHFDVNRKKLMNASHPLLQKQREEAVKYFTDSGLPTHKHEKWRSSQLVKGYDLDYHLESEQVPYEKSVSEIFQCEIHGYHAHIVSMLNGRYYHRQPEALQRLENGVLIGSILTAQKEEPELFEKYFGSIADHRQNGFAAINTALFSDGIFIYVPDGVEVENAIQLIKMINREEKLMIHSRNLIILGKNSKLSFMHCDDSVNHFSTFINTMTEFHIGENASLDLYKLQNINDQTSLLNNTYIHQERDSRSRVSVLSLNGGKIRNELHVDLAGQGAEADLNGVYLMDKKQHIDNQVTVRHLVPNCYSSELFKGVLDDEATGVFNGYIYVEKDAQKTNAFQQNNNILITPQAQIDTMPFLEIYADDVKCSHGATVGQLDQDALFYLMQRGIGREDARMLLMYAFTSEVTSKIGIEPLRVSIEDMIKKRLRGELSICEKCVLHCSIPDKPIEFEIDMSKV
jgi:Fe-S cluster assembly protein SufD